jgi:hypothetical protein
MVNNIFTDIAIGFSVVLFFVVFGLITSGVYRAENAREIKHWHQGPQDPLPTG